MAQKWPTPRRCQRCSNGQEKNYYWAQEWGRADDGRMEYKLDCLKCFQIAYSFWDGHSAFSRPDIHKKGD